MSQDGPILRKRQHSPLIVFDLGGVIVRICRSIKEAGDRCGISVREEDITPERRAERRAIHARYERGQITCDEFFAAIAQTTGGRFSPDQFRAMHLAWIIDEYPGVSRLIDDLHAAGFPTGVLSNTNASHWAQMQPIPDARGVIQPPNFPRPQSPPTSTPPISSVSPSPTRRSTTSSPGAPASHRNGSSSSTT